jgi:tol-pal system protein YbgF
MPRAGLALRLRLARRATCAAFAVVLGAAGSACARAETAADKHFAEMRDQIAKMQAEQDRTDQRLSSLEVAFADEKSGRLVEGQAADPKPGAKSYAPPPRVVALGGEPPAENDDPNDPSPRPEIRLVGRGAPARTPRGQDARKTRDEPLPSIRTEGSARPSALDPEAKKAYEAALAQVQAKSYDRGLEALTAFLVRWPDHPYAENATYWRGEALYGKGEYLRAAEQFEAVLARFGGGAKAADALLKLGMCHERLGSPERAREYWDRLRADYPRSDAAKRIPRESAKDDRSPKGPKESR